MYPGGGWRDESPVLTPVWFHSVTAQSKLTPNIFFNGSQCHESSEFKSDFGLGNSVEILFTTFVTAMWASQSFKGSQLISHFTHSVVSEDQGSPKQLMSPTVTIRSLRDNPLTQNNARWTEQTRPSFWCYMYRNKCVFIVARFGREDAIVVHNRT